MKISAFSKVVELNKKTIHYYIEQGLIHPKKNDNNYYEFDENNIKECQMIKIYRHLGFSISNISNSLKYPTFTNYFLYQTAHQIKEELYHKQLQLENIKKILDSIPPYATFEDITNFDITNLNDTLQYPCITNQYPMDNSYLLCCFLLVPWVSATPNQYRKYLFTQMSNLLYSNLKDAYNYLEHFIYSVDIKDLDKSSSDICYLMIDIDKADDITNYYNMLKDKCYKLLNNEDLKEKWILEYNKLIVPTENFYNRVSELLYNEYSEDFRKCRNNLKAIFKMFVDNEKELMDTLKISLNNSINFDISEPFNDLYMILIYDISLYVIEDSEKIRKYL